MSNICNPKTNLCKYFDDEGKCAWCEYKKCSCPEDVEWNALTGCYYHDRICLCDTEFFCFSCEIFAAYNEGRYFP